MRLKKYLKSQKQWANIQKGRATDRADSLNEETDEWNDALDDEYFYGRLADYLQTQLEWLERRKDG